MRLHVDLRENGYDIILEHGVLHHLNEYIDLNRKVMIITDDLVPDIYTTIVQKQCLNAHVHIISHGEESKSFAVYEEIQKDLLEHKFSRKDCIIALGGGVVGDLSGFVASTYMRGIDFIQIPTTTLSQIDSSIGGKVAINLNGVKNVIGAFYQPKIVFIDPDTLKTLPRRHYINGLIEALKEGLIYDASLFELFEQGDINNNLDLIIEKALRVKKDVVEKDEKEMGLRKILNFGHTIGHAIESYYHLSEYLHGECVAFGMPYFIDNETIKERLSNIYKHLKLPPFPEIDPAVVFSYLCKDKKASGNSISVVHVNEIGKSYIKETPLQDIERLLKGK